VSLDVSVVAIVVCNIENSLLNGNASGNNNRNDNCGNNNYLANNSPQATTKI